MPTVYRVMSRDDDGLPSIRPTALGVRRGLDIDVDEHGSAVPNDKGMSVSPTWRVLPPRRIPKRLHGQGSNSTYCFKCGTGPFIQSAFAPGLELLPDSPKHGVIRPTQLVPLTEYETSLAATRADWQIDET